MIADLEIYENGSGGDLNLKNDDLSTIQGLTNQVYLAFFGGNIEGNTKESSSELDQRTDWWANEYLKKEFQFNSNLERALKMIALNGAGLRVVEDAAKEDLKFLEQFAGVEISTEISSKNKLTIFVNIIEPGKQSLKIKFVWDGTKQEIIETTVL